MSLKRPPLRLIGWGVGQVKKDLAAAERRLLLNLLSYPPKAPHPHSPRGGA